MTTTELYEELYRSNPICHMYDQLYPNIVTIPELLTKISNIDVDKYNQQNSLIYQYSTQELFEMKSEKEFCFNTYHIAICICHTTEQPGRTIYNGNFHDYNCYADFFSQKSITIIPVHNHKNSTKCKKSTMLNTGIWCESCYGPFNSAHNFFLLMNKTMEFRNIPQDSILVITKSTENLDLTNEIHSNKLKIFLEADNHQITNLMQSIDTFPKKLDDVINRMRKDNDIAKDRLKTILDQYGGSIEKFNSINNLMH